MNISTIIKFLYKFLYKYLYNDEKLQRDVFTVKLNNNLKKHDNLEGYHP